MAEEDPARSGEGSRAGSIDKADKADKATKAENAGDVGGPDGSDGPDGPDGGDPLGNGSAEPAPVRS